MIERCKKFRLTLKPEAAYLYPDPGLRTALMVLDMKDASELHAIAEPFFSKLNAAVEIIPVMNADDLKKGLAKVKQAAGEAAVQPCELFLVQSIGGIDT